jgi:type IV secretory pathway VirD2 relaxase
MDGECLWYLLTDLLIGKLSRQDVEKEILTAFDIEHRRRVAAEELIKYMSESGMSVVPWNDTYKRWQESMSGRRKWDAAHE